MRSFYSIALVAMWAVTTPLEAGKWRLGDDQTHAHSQAQGKNARSLHHIKGPYAASGKWPPKKPSFHENQDSSPDSAPLASPPGYFLGECSLETQFILEWLSSLQGALMQYGQTAEDMLAWVQALIQHWIQEGHHIDGHFADLNWQLVCAGWGHLTYEQWLIGQYEEPVEYTPSVAGHVTPLESGEGVAVDPAAAMEQAFLDCIANVAPPRPPAPFLPGASEDSAQTGTVFNFEAIETQPSYVQAAAFQGEVIQPEPLLRVDVTNAPNSLFNRRAMRRSAQNLTTQTTVELFPHGF